MGKHVAVSWSAQYRAVMLPADSLPTAHDPVGPLTRTVEVLSLAAAAVLLTASAGRLVTSVDLRWWIPLVIVAAGLAADLMSGLVHWAADTWGRETLPVLGRRFLRPFRVHHVNPDDFLRRDFIDCNGDVAMLTLPLLAAALLLPTATPGAGLAAASFVTRLPPSALPTNQVHQWAHMPHPPRAGRDGCSARGLILAATRTGNITRRRTRELLHRHRLVQPLADDMPGFSPPRAAIVTPHRPAAARRRGSVCFRAPRSASARRR